jgi:hypothetical protein
MNLIHEVSEFIVSNMAADVYMTIQEDANEDRRRGRQREVPPTYATGST